MIRVENLTFKYKNKAVFTDFDLIVEKGKILGLLGKNGAGKSTLLYLITGLLMPQKGRITYNSANVSKRLPSTLYDIFIIPEEFSLPNVSLQRFMKINSPFYPKFSEEQLMENLTHFELDINKKIHLDALSLGEKKKVFMSFALAANTSLLIMDEPTNGLDIQENWKKYLLQFLTVFGIMVVMSIWFFYPIDESNSLKIIDSHNKQLLSFVPFLFLGFGIIFASTLMESVRRKTTRIAYLTMPASHLEKFLSRWLIITIGFVIAFFIALWMADAVRVAFLSYKYPGIGIRLLDFSKLIDPKDDQKYNDYVFFSKYFFVFCISFYGLLQSLFILGATFWEKLSFVKTFSAIVLIATLFIYLNKWVIEILFGDMSGFESIHLLSCHS